MVIKLTALLCRDEYIQVLDVLRKFVSSIVAVRKSSELTEVDEVQTLLYLGCHVESKELSKLTDSSTISTVIVYSPAAKVEALNILSRFGLGRSTIVFVQPIIGLIRMILSRSRALFDYIKIIKVILSRSTLNSIAYLYGAGNTSMNSNVMDGGTVFTAYIREAAVQYGVNQLSVELIDGGKPIEIVVYGVQFNREKKLIYSIVEGVSTAQLMAAELHSYIQLIASGFIGEDVVTPESIGMEEGLFTYYMANLMSIVGVEVDIRFAG